MSKDKANLANMLSVSGSYPVRGGNHVEPLIDGEPAFGRICSVVKTAKKSVWVTVAFIHDEFKMPGAYGSFFDVLDAAYARGIDVRVIFWRNNDGSGFDENHMFSGSADHRAMLQNRGSKFLIRWDRAQKRYCQHQKSWIIDAGTEDEVAFVGGINLEPNSVVSPGHQRGDHPHTHDIYLQLEGPCATDVHHNFVQRWNEASERDEDDGTWPNKSQAGELMFPSRTSPTKGNVIAQVQRTVRAGHYTDGTAAPGASYYDIASGERSCFEQYDRAITLANKYVYLENQSLGQPETVEALHAALERGVTVTVLVPADANGFMVEARKDPRAKPFFDRFDALSEHTHFLLAGIARTSSNGQRENIYVHAKAGIIDDHWATVGSCNIGARSFFGDTELNVSFLCTDSARKFRAALFQEHLSLETSGLDGVEASRLFQDKARENTSHIANGRDMSGLVFALNPRTYGV